MKGNKREKFNQVYEALEPLRNAKSTTIHALAGVGKKYRVLRYPILAFLFVFLFVYNAILYTLIHFQVHEKPARILSGLMVVCLVVNCVYVPALASGSGTQTEAVCENHTCHDASCGYVEAVEAQPCQHVHGDECYITNTVCVHVHDDSCYETESVLVCGLEEGSTEAVETEEGTEAVAEGHVHTEECYSEVQNLVCSHSCSEESGCVTRELNCQHTHDETCGYREAVEGQPCTHSCSACDGSGEEVPEVTPEATPTASAEAVPSVAPGTTPEVLPTAAPGTTPEVSPTATPGTTPEVSPTATPGTTPGVSTSATPEATPSASPEATPTVSPTVVPSPTPTVLPAEVAFEQTVVRNGIEITVSAPAGVFPAGALLHVEMITDEAEVSEIEQLVTEKKEETTADDVVTVVEQSYSFDITIVDEEGNEIEPDTTCGQVSVTFKNVGVTEVEQQEDKELTVFYVSDDHTEAEEINHEADAAEDSAAITAEHFSIYTVVITSGEKKDTILHYYQGTSRAVSYFTVYNEEQLLRYRDLMNGYYVDGSVLDENTISTILVNSDDANPMDGITGMGQAADMTVADLNFSVKIMDDITVQSEWSPVKKLPAGLVFDGAGHTITFTGLASGITFDGTNADVLIQSNDGTLKRITLRHSDKSYTISELEEPESGLYATVTVRVDGEKAEIGEAITGAEALAASCDGVNYITLERADDLAVYRTPLENLYDLSEDADPADAGKVYTVYYVYEDENETISAAEITKENYEAELNYVSVHYDLEGANTYSYADSNENNIYDVGVDGELSENVMASIRVDVLENGTYEAQEDYRAVVMAAEGYEIPTRGTNVIIKLLNEPENENFNYSYTYDADNKLGSIRISREKITGPISVTVKADSLEDNPPNTIILKTRGGDIIDPLWEKTATGVYTQAVYENVALPAEITTYKGSDAIRFAGWYTNMNCTGSPVTVHTYTEGGTKTYYAKWVLDKTSSHSDNVYYQYKNGNLEMQGYPYSDPGCMVTFGYSGFGHLFKTGELSPSERSGSFSPTTNNFASMVSTEGDDIFKQLSGTNIYVALVCTLEDSLVDVTYIFENRGTSAYTDKLYFGASADVMIAGDDWATVEPKDTAGGVSYLNMTSRSDCKTNADRAYPNAVPDQQFRLYTDGFAFGVDKLFSFWYGGYSYRDAHIFAPTTYDKKFKGDSGLSFSWEITEDIPVGQYITRTTKMGLSDVNTMNNIIATLEAGSGCFSDGTSSMKKTSDQKSITVNTDGTITIKKSTGNETIQPPTRSGYKFKHWSVGAEDENKNCAGSTGKEFTESVTLYANWIPQPDKSVTNNCSVQKVNGSSNLLVPEALGNIVIINNTPGATTERIKQGDTAQEAAGYASGFACTLSMEGEDDRYLLPDDIEVTVTDAESGAVTKLTKDTGYSYSVYDNRKKAFLEINRRYINGDITITAIGYELPPVTATSVSITVPQDTISYGERAVFTAHAETSKNHVASYQWYIAPYYEIELDNELSWTYQNQDGVALQNGTFGRGDTVYDALYGKIKAESDTPFAPSGTPITISGANKATLRISGLDVNPFEIRQGESMEGLQYGGYHVYCVVTSTRNITGQEIVAVSNVAELKVTTAQYAPPSGIEGSATTYYGGTDGSIILTAQANRPTLKYRKSGQIAWNTVTDAQLEAGEITGLTAGTYEFKYAADENHTESDSINVEVENGRYIIVTYRAPGCDDTSLRTQYKHVSYGSTVTAGTASQVAGETVQNPARTGYTFAGWNPAVINGITENTTVNAVYTYGIYEITLDNQEATTSGTAVIYEKYSAGFYAEEDCTNPVNGVSGITIPQKEGYNFLGYYTEADGGIQMICADGCLSENMSATRYLDAATLYAHWEAKPVDFNVLPDVNDPDGGTSGGDTPGTEPDADVQVSVKPTDPDTPGEGTDPDDPGTGGEDSEYSADTSYEVTITNRTGKEANVVSIYSDGILKRTLTNAVFDENNQYTFTLIPSEVGGGSITFVLGYVSSTTEEGAGKTPEEIETEAEEQAANLNYTITYKEVNGSTTGTAFTGTFVTTAPEKGVKGVATTLPEAEKTGYTFGGWYTAPRGTGRAVTEISASNTADEVVVYAKWIANKYTITLKTNGGSYAENFAPAEQYQHGGSNVTLPDSTRITRENYTFLGWFDKEELLGDAVTEVDTAQVGRVTYYAGWELLPAHTVTLRVDDEKYTITPDENFDFVPGEDEDGSYYAVNNIYDGKEYQFTVAVKPAYKLKAVKANGKLLVGEDGVFTIAAVTDDIIVTVGTEKLVSTTETEVSDAAATIKLDDGTIGYFESIAAAIEYAANYGNNSVIQLQKDFEDIEIDALKGITAYSIDLNGHTVGSSAEDGDSTLLIEDGAVVTLLDSQGTPNGANKLSIENRGELTNEIVVGELLNLGITNNHGTVLAMTQQDSETYEKSKFENYGSIGTAKLEHGYFVEHVLENAPEGLTGYNTIMNGNEYYVDFRDAVDIANASEGDATILVLSTVDNRNTTIDLNNQNGYAITVDLNGCNLSSGTVTTSGKVSFVNGKGSATCISEISASIDNNGELTIGEYVKVSGELTNEEDGKVQVEPNAVVSGPVNNKGTFDNDGNVTGVFTNEGDTTNDGTMNNVIQKDGDFHNNNEVKTKVEMEGGSYTPAEEAAPQIPDGAVAKSNTTPVTYYGKFEDAVKDANEQDPSDPDVPSPFEITILKDIPDDRLGDDTPVVLDPDVPVVINLNNHELGDGSDPEKGIQIGQDGGETPAGSDSGVTLKNEPENGEDADTGKGIVKTPLKVEEDGSLDVGKDITAKDVDNDGKLKVEKDGNIEKLTNRGDTENNGNLKDVDQKGGSLSNGEDGNIQNLNQEGGDTNNAGKIEKLTQTGGNTENQEGGTIEDADIDKGGYTGKAPEKINGATPADETDGKVAKITPPGGGEPVYFVSLDDALEYAAGMENGPVTVELLKDITEEEIDFTTAKNPVTPVILDLNGHNVTTPSTIHTGEGTSLTITDSKPDGEKGTVSAPVTNDGDLTIDEGISVSGDVTNSDKGKLNNKGNISGDVNNAGDIDNDGTVTGDVENTGDFDNAGEVTGTVEQKDGTYTNEEGATTNQIVQTGGKTVNQDDSETAPGGIGDVDLQRGSYEGDEPSTPIDNAVAKIGDKLYGDLQSAIEDANQSEEDVNIELLKDVTLPETPALVIDNTNGKEINIDLKGNDITGGKIQIGSDTGEGGSTPADSKVTFTDTGSPETGEKGKIGSDIDVKKDGDLTLGEDVTATGDLDNAGKTTNNGTIAPGNVTNTGDMENNGDIGGQLKQENGTFTNGETGTVGDVEQTGGTLDNQNPNGGIDSADVSGGEFKGQPADDMEYSGAKVAVITQNPDGSTNTTYYPSLEEALNDTEGNATLKLLDDIKGENGETIVVDKPGITIDLNGHEIGEPSDMEITENATDTKLTDSSEGKSGSVTVPIDNKGDLTIEEGVEASKVENSGKLNNEGEITELINNGDTTNGGTIGSLKQESGSVKNSEDGNITSVEFDGGSYEGKNPTTMEGDAVAKIGDKLYGDLASAIKDANQSPEDVTIEVLKDTSLPDAANPDTPVTEIGNENGKKITLDLGGNKVSGGPVEVKAPGTTEITDSSTDGIGALQTDMKVDSGANLMIDEGTTVEGDIENKGTTENKGNIAGNVSNKEGGDFKNNGEIDGDVENAGEMENTGDILGDVTNDESGSFRNEGENSYIGGDVENQGDMENQGIISGEVDNTGDLNNSGNIDNNVTNRGNGTFDNDGNVNGQLENKDNAKTDNCGKINQVKQSGGELDNDQGGEISEYLQTGGDLNNGSDGKISDLTQTGGKTNNEGRIDDASISDLNNYSGKQPESGLDGVEASITYSDENGNPKTEYFSSLEEALEAAREKNSDGNSPVTVTLTESPFVIDSPVTIPEGVTLEVPEGNKIVIGENGDLDNRGNIHIDEGGELDIQSGGKLSNSGNLDNEGSLTNEEGGSLTNKTGGNLTNSGSLTNEEGGSLKNEEGGSLTNKGENSYIEGDVENAGDMSNEGRIEGDVDNTGNLNNTGDLTNVVNRENGSFDNDGDVTGKLENKDNATTDNSGNIHDVEQSGGKLNNVEGGSIEEVNQSGGELNNVEGGSIEEVNQSGGELNNGENGTIEEVNQSGGKLNNGENGTIGDLNQTGGKTNNEGRVDRAEVSDLNGYTGKLPEAGLPGAESSITYEDENGNPKTEYYSTLEEALEAAQEKNAEGEKPVTVTPVTTPVVINSPVSVPEGVTLTIPSDNQITIGEGGSLDNKGNIQIEEDGELDIQSGGKLTNSGNLGNGGNLKIEEGGSLTNEEGGSLTNKTGGNLTNSGSLKNEEGGSLKNEEGGSLTNKGENSYIEGDVENAGDMSNEGRVEGNVDNTGNLNNTGDLTNVVNRENGSFDNDGDVTGKLENKDNATIDNSGNIHDVEQSGGEMNNGENGTIGDLNQTGGSTNNEGQVDRAEVSNLNGYTGKLPEAGLPGAESSITYEDENGNPKTEYYSTLEEALEAAQEKNAEGEKPVTVTPVTSPVVINSPVSVPEGVTLEVPEGSKVVIGDGGSLENKGNIRIEEGGTLTNEEGGILQNQGNIVNGGTLENNKGGKIINAGDISSKAPGFLANNGTIDNNNGSLNGASDADGSTVNNGAISGGNVAGPLENGKAGTISGIHKLSGDITNEGRIEMSHDADTSSAVIQNLPGSSYVKKDPESTNTNNTDDEEEDDVPAVEETVVKPVNTDTVTVTKKPSAGTEADEKKAEETTGEEEPSSENRIEELIHQALETGNIVVAGTDSFGETIAENKLPSQSVSGFSETGVMNTVIAEEEMASIVKAVLTDKEKQAVLDGETVSLRAEVARIEDEKVSVKYQQAVLDAIPEDKRTISFLQMSLFKKIGDSEEVKVGIDSPIKVSFEIPAEYRSVDGEPIEYQIVRVYTDEAGNVCTEQVEFTMEENVVSMFVDSSSEYALVVEKGAVLLVDSYAQGGTDVITQNLVKEPEGGHGYMWMIPTVILILLGTGYTLRRKGKENSKKQ